MAAKRSVNRTSKANGKRRTPPSARRVRGGLQCPDCDFVARHAMGLGRHRSSRHGVQSKRAARSGGARAWLTRHQAAERAGVHYNTVRGWEELGLLRTTTRPGIRGVLISRGDLDKLLAERSGTGVPITAEASVDEAVQALQTRLDELISGLEALVAKARGTTARRRVVAPAKGAARTAGATTRGRGTRSRKRR